MKILCISASNVIDRKGKSASTKVCNLIKEITDKHYDFNINFEIAELLDYNLRPCTMCTQCSDTGSCVMDEDYNRLYKLINECDGIFVVCPHYAPIPSKVMIMLEKLEEKAYIAYCTGNVDSYKLSDKPVAVIAHGGQSKNFEEGYKKMILEPLNYIFASLGMEVVGVNNETPKGVVFGITSMEKNEEKMLPEMVHDWKDIMERVTPLVHSMIKLLERKVAVT